MLTALMLLLAVADVSVTAEGCVTAEAFAGRVQALVRPEVFESADAKIQVTTEARGEGWAVRVRGETFERTIEAETCEAGVEAAALVVALSIDPEAMSVTAPPAEPEPEPEPKPEPKQEQEPEPDPASEPESEPKPEPKTAPSPLERDTPAQGARFDAALGVGLHGGVAPGPGGHAALALAARWRLGSVELGVMGAWPRTVDVGGNAQARLQTWTGVVRGCLHVPGLGAGTVVVPACGVVHVGRMLGEGLGQGIQGRQRGAHWGGAGASIGVRWWPLDHVGLAVGLEGLAVFSPPALSIEGAGRACCGARVAGFATVGPAFRL